MRKMSNLFKVKKYNVFVLFPTLQNVCNCFINVYKNISLPKNPDANVNEIGEA